MTNPVMDKQCGHSFEKEAVAAHIKQTLKRKKSPKYVLFTCILARLQVMKQSSKNIAYCGQYRPP